MNFRSISTCVLFAAPVGEHEGHDDQERNDPGERDEGLGAAQLPARADGHAADQAHGGQAEPGSVWKNWWELYRFKKSLRSDRNMHSCLSSRSPTLSSTITRSLFFCSSISSVTSSL